MGVLKSFLNSEKAVASGVLVIAATVLVAVGKITVQEWMDYTEVLLGIYVGGKALQGSAAAIAAARKPPEAAAAPEDPEDEADDEDEDDA